LSACATTGGRASLDPSDPYEKFNRGTWAFNQAIDKVAIKPVTKIYRAVAPKPARRGISHIFSNLSEPFSAINNLLQGKPKRAFNSLGRFLINSTIGVGGLADHATRMGLPRTPEDFGQTLAVAGARKSPYLVLPIFGPSTVRDALGTAVEFVADPARIVMSNQLTTTQNYAVTGVRLIDARSRATEDGLDALAETSADPYAAARSAYLQSRDAEIRDEEEGALSQATSQDEQELLDKALEDENVTVPQAPSGDSPSETATEPELSANSEAAEGPLTTGTVDIQLDLL
jgi:phospholipid-binding lipoprotein MlaA